VRRGGKRGGKGKEVSDESGSFFLPILRPSPIKIEVEEKGDKKASCCLSKQSCYQAVLTVGRSETNPGGKREGGEKGGGIETERILTCPD